MKHPRFLVLATMVIWAVPNNEAAWVNDRIYDACMATAGDDDWACEDRLNSLPSAVDAP